MIRIGTATLIAVGVVLACGARSFIANRRVQAGARYVAAH